VSLLPYEPGRPEQDPRATQPFGSAWRLGSLARLVPAGVASVTYEAIDQVLADAMSPRGSDVLDVSSSHPRDVAALALSSGRGAVLLLANLSSIPKTVDMGQAIELAGYESRLVEFE
jgi:hypothetical protein